MATGSGGSAQGIRAGRAYVEIGVLNNVGKGLDAVKQSLSGMGSKFLAGGSLLGLGAAGAYGVLDRLDSSANKLASTYEELSQRYGSSAEELSAFTYAAELNGVTFDRLGDNYENYTERVKQAAMGTGEAVETFKQLGLNARDLIRLSLPEQMQLIADAFKKMGNSQQDINFKRGSLSALFSDKGQGMMKFLNLGGDGIRNLMAEAKTVGAVVTTEEANNAAKIEREYNRLFASVKAVAYQIGLALAPSEEFLGGAVRGAQQAAIKVREWVKENRDLIQTVETGVYATLGLSAAVVAVGGSFKLMAVGVSGLAIPLKLVSVGLGAFTTIASAGFTIIGAGWSVLSAVFSGGAAIAAASIAGVGTALAALKIAVFALPIAIVAGGAAWLAFSDRGRRAIQSVYDGAKSGAQTVSESLSRYFTAAFANISETWKLTMTALGRGDFVTAYSLVFATLKTEIARATVELTKVWNGFQKDFVDSWKQSWKEIVGTAGSAVGIIKGLIGSLKVAKLAAEAAIPNAPRLSDQFKGILNFAFPLLGPIQPLARAIDLVRGPDQVLEQNPNQKPLPENKRPDGIPKFGEAARQAEQDNLQADRDKRQGNADKNLAEAALDERLVKLKASIGQVAAATAEAFTKKPGGPGGPGGGSENIIGNMAATIRQSAAAFANAQSFGPQSMNLQMREQQKTNQTLEKAVGFLEIIAEKVQSNADEPQYYGAGE
jgi:hypothetical protein